MKERVKQVIAKIRPLLQMEGGDIELLDVSEDGVVKVRLIGACASCPMSSHTLELHVKETIKNEVPEVKEVIAA